MSRIYTIWYADEKTNFHLREEATRKRETISILKKFIREANEADRGWAFVVVRLGERIVKKAQFFNSSYSEKS